MTIKFTGLNEVQVFLPLTIPVIREIVFIIPSLFLSLIYVIYVVVNPDKHPPNQVNLFKEYDFIVVGGGSAGSVVANRLSENVFDSVLLLEAGGDENEISDTPTLVHYLQLSDMDWQYKVEPQTTACLGIVGNRCNWPRGKVLGGSSVLNYMLYVRGNRRDYDGWEALGNPGWGFDDVLPYFKKSEDNRNPSLARNTEFHSTGGYLTVTEPPWRTPLAEFYVRAGVELGYRNIDYNSRFQTGIMIPQATLRDGSRCSTSKAFLRPAGKRKNLHIAKHSFVTKVIIDPVTMRAQGVRFVRYGKVFTIMARKEIIVSAGSINTPQLLMLSGIGPRDHLSSHGIPVIKDAPVGNNLQDHMGNGGIVFTFKKKIAIVEHRYSNIWTLLKYVLFGKGPLTQLGGLEGVAFLDTVNGPSGVYPDIQIQFQSGTYGQDGGKQLKKVFAFREEVYRKLYFPLSFKDGITMFVLLLRPRSRGTVRLRSSNPFHKPIINANYLDHPDDIAALVRGSREAIRFGRTSVFQQIGARLYTVPPPGCEQHTNFESDAALECLTRHITITVYHPVGTAKMGPDEATCVVDPQLRVHGISGLRVIDGSIMPTITSGNTNAPIIMIGEKGADLIKDFWAKKRRRKKR